MSLTKIKPSNITATGVTAGSYTAADITVNSSGQITGAASNSVVASGGGGGPKITSIQVTDNSYNVLDDTAVDVLGGYIKITGSGFASGCLVYFNQTPAASVSFVSGSELLVTTGALLAGTYVLYAINTDGGVAISVPGVTFSATPSWQTASTLPDQYDNTAISLSLVAGEATSYTLTSGSLPPGLSLNTSTGAITGTVTTVIVDTSYTFTVRATDAQNQDSPRTFTITITVSDPYFRLTTLLLGGEQGNTVIKDSSTNNFNLTVAGDARASNFTPYGTGWSNYFDGTGDYLTVADSTALDMESSDFTMEAWIYPTNSFASLSNGTLFSKRSSNAVFGGVLVLFGGSNAPIFRATSTNSSWDLVNSTSSVSVIPLQWNHIAIARSSGTWALWVNGIRGVNVTGITGIVSNNAAAFGLGANADGSEAWPTPVYVSSARVIKGTAVYDPIQTTITVPTVPLTAISNTSLLTCQSNRFVDLSTNNFAITKNGDVAVRSFNPFGITNTGDSGSIYLDGTGDYLTIPNSSNLDLTGSINYTIEAWVYLTGYGSTADLTYAIANQFTSTGGAGYLYGLFGSGADQGKARFYGGAGAVALTATNAVPLNTWNHVAFVKSGTTYTHYLNGITNGSTTTASTINTSSEVFGIGKYITSGYTDLFKGYIADIRVTKGTAVYTANFTPPTSSLTAIANTQLLTLQYRQPHNNHGFQDSSSNNFLITRNGNASQGTFSPFSQTGWSVYFDGSSSLTKAYETAWNFGSGDFSIECWFNSKSTNQYASLISADGSGSAGWALLINPTANDGKVMLHFDGPSISPALTTSVGGYNDGSWHHVAVVRNSSSLVLYIDGTARATSTISGSASLPGTLYLGNSAVAGRALTGYLSNVRIVKGTGVYTNNFNTPTTPLTAITNTSLLTCHANRFLDASSNGFTIARNGNTRVMAFSPFAPAQVYSPTTHGTSAYFDGSGDFLTIGSTSDFILGANDFCLELWHYSLTETGAGIVARRTAQAAVGWVIGVRSFASLLGGVWYDPVVGITSSYKKNEWVHIVMTRSGNNWRFFENGILIDYQTRSGSINDMTQYLVNIGRAASSTEEGPFTGYTTDIALTIGSIPSQYQTSSTTTNTQIFSVPTALRSSNTNTNFLVKGDSAAILDRTGRNVVETMADTKASSVQVKYGTGAMYFDGTGDWINMPASPFNAMGTGDFTIECWIYPTKISTTNGIAIFSNRTDGTANSTFGLLWSNSRGLYLHTFTTPIFDSGVLPTINVWQHVAYVRASGVIKIYLNGTQIGTSASFTNDLSSTIGFYVGKDGTHTGSGAEPYQGYIDDLRVTKFARYTSNFTAPTGAHRLK